MTVWSPDGRTQRREPLLAEREGIGLLAGVGNELEWWVFSRAMVGSVRVGLTDVEHEAIDACVLGPVVADAGESGPLRRRSRPRLR